uniref:Uncharacterized protein n=1 Tax=Heterorhabditis bacteriophora TaxID=37862 RepID=A0A1I7XRW1_HETBA
MHFASTCIVMGWDKIVLGDEEELNFNGPDSNMKCFSDKNINIIKWSSLFLNLKPIEDLQSLSK